MRTRIPFALLPRHPGSIQTLADLLGPPPAAVVAWEQRTYAHLMHPQLQGQSQQQHHQQQQQQRPSALVSQRPSSIGAHDGLGRESLPGAVTARKVALHVEGAAAAGPEAAGEAAGDEAHGKRLLRCTPTARMPSLLPSVGFGQPGRCEGAASCPARVWCHVRPCRAGGAMFAGQPCLARKA